MQSEKNTLIMGLEEKEQIRKGRFIHIVRYKNYFRSRKALESLQVRLFIPLFSSE